MIQLTDHFSLEEMTNSETAQRLGISNTPTEQNIECLRNLCINVLEPLRAYMKRPLHVNSGYRCPDLNKAVGGVLTSQHQEGKAADIAANNLKDGRKMLEYVAAELVFDQCFVETNGIDFWLHVSYVTPEEENRYQIKLLQRK